MSIVQKLIDFIKTYPDLGTSDLFIDFTKNDEDSNTIVMPAGSIVLSRQSDVTDTDTLEMQYNCSILLRRYFLNGDAALENQTFIEDLQMWLIEQNYKGTVPQVGDDKDYEYLTANNGTLLELNQDSSTALYSIQFSLTYIKRFQFEWR